MKPIGLAGFEEKFEGDDDPWRTFSNRDEARKRAAIVHGLGAGPLGRVLELGAGNGSNSAAIAERALRLDATEATAAGTALVARTLTSAKRARAIQLAVPSPFPRSRYDVVVIAELLYYLSPRAMAETARDVGRALRGGGTLILAHHRIDFYDFVQRAGGIHARFLDATGLEWTTRTIDRNADWIVMRAQPRGKAQHLRHLMR